MFEYIRKSTIEDLERYIILWECIKERDPVPWVIKKANKRIKDYKQRIEELKEEVK